MTLVSIVQLDHLTNEFGLKLEEGSGPDEGSSSHDNKDKDKDKVEAASLSLVSLNLPPQDKERLRRAAHILRQRLILRLWLDDHGLLDYASKLVFNLVCLMFLIVYKEALYCVFYRFNSLGVNSIEDAYWFEDVLRLEELVGVKIVGVWMSAREALPSDLTGLENLKQRLWSRIIQEGQHSIWNSWGGLIYILTLPNFISFWVLRLLFLIARYFHNYYGIMDIMLEATFNFLSLHFKHKIKHQQFSIYFSNCLIALIAFGWTSMSCHYLCLQFMNLFINPLV